MSIGECFFSLALMLVGVLAVAWGIEKIKYEREGATPIDESTVFITDTDRLFDDCRDWAEVVIAADQIVSNRIGGRWLNGKSYTVEAKKGVDNTVDSAIRFIEKYGKNHGVEIVYTDHPTTKVKESKWSL